MKLGILTNVCCNLSLDEALHYFTGLGIECVEIGCGGTPGIHHCDPEVLLNDEQAFQEFKQAEQKKMADARSHRSKEIARKNKKPIAALISGLMVAGCAAGGFAT